MDKYLEIYLLNEYLLIVFQLKVAISCEYSSTVETYEVVDQKIVHLPKVVTYSGTPI